MRSRLSFIALVAAMGLIGLGLFSLGHRVDSLGSQLEQSDSDRTQLRADLKKQRDASATLAEQVEALGGKPAVTTGGDVVAGPEGKRGPAPTAAQIRAGVDAWCSVGDRCKPPGPSRQQMVAAVAAHCASGNCQGSPGRDGQDGQGTDGKDGQDGAPGPGPTDAQIAAGIATYCSNDSCRGPKGDAGPPGSVTPGSYACPDGQWVSAIDVTTDGSMALTCSPLLGQD